MGVSFLGHLFVGNQLLNESGMKDHPLTPMADQTLPGYGPTGQGTGQCLESCRAKKEGSPIPLEKHVIGDAVEFSDLEFLASNTPSNVLLTGGVHWRCHCQKFWESPPLRIVRPTCSRSSNNTEW